jgi:hypothetical protein
MPLGTLERSAPSLFRQGPFGPVPIGALQRVGAVFDGGRHPVAHHRPAAQDGGCHPVSRPVAHAPAGGVGQPWNGYVQSLQDAKAQAEAARAQMARQALQAHQSDTLAQENEALRKLLGLRERLAVPSLAAQILYETADPYTRRGHAGTGGQDAGVQPGSPVLDGRGGAGPGHAGLSVCERGHAGHRPGPGDSRAQCAHGCAGGWRMATRWPATAVAWSCALSRPMPMYKTGMCWPPMASMVSILQACPWPVWCVWNAGRTRRLRASTVSRLPPPKGRAMCWCCNRKLCGCPSAGAHGRGSPCSQEGA